MHFLHLLTALFYALCCLDTAVARHPIPKRQDSSSLTTAPPTSTTASQQAASSSAPSTSLSSSDDKSSQTSPSTSSHDASPSSTITSSKSTSTAVPSSSTTSSASSTATSTAPAHPLPLPPVITPAIGIAGVILIVAGLALTLIGIKHSTVYIFLSTAFLTSLAVTVLIIYLMSPPVSDAIQGGFFVAAVVTGVLFGALSLLFKEVSEGLGCLLGGFCLGMWFLVLAPGGLVHSTTGRAIMIAVFCVAGWSLAFSHYTRNYGLIVGLSFGGATATIIGIDCFSKAGLKEFWLYIWNLNKNEFPLGTTTYPITRGIRVEIAGVIILFCFGLMSQFKIWKIVKERRARLAAVRLRDLESRDQNDAAAGKEIEAKNERDLAQWEAQYGEGENKAGARATVANTDSALGSSLASLVPKRSASVTEREARSIELDEISHAGSPSDHRTSKADPRVTVTVNVAQDDHGEEDDGVRSAGGVGSRDGMVLLDGEDGQRRPSRIESYKSNTNSNRASSEVTDEQLNPQREGLPPVPQVVPLPFSPPLEADEDRGERAGRSSVYTKVTAGERLSSDRVLPLNLFSLGQHNRQQRSSAPQIEEDRASSLAATADEDLDLSNRRNSQALLSLSFEPATEGGLTPLSQDRSTADGRPLSYFSTAVPEAPVEENDDEELVRPATAVQEPPPPARPASKVTRQSTKSPTHRSRRSLGSIPSSRDDPFEDDDNDAQQSVAGSLTGHLPGKLSKVALAYRTNEWAKHIADADQPHAEELPESHSPGIQVDPVFAEASRPVDPSALVGGSIIDQSTVAAQEQRQQSKRASKAPENTRRKGEAANNLSRRTSAGAITPVYAFNRTSSQPQLQRSSSSQSFAGPSQQQAKQQLKASTRTPFTNDTLVESPVEETETVALPFERSISAMQKQNPVYAGAPLQRASSSTNLLDERNTRLKRKTTSTSFNALAGSSSTHNLHTLASAPNLTAAIDSPNSPPREIPFSVEDPTSRAGAVMTPAVDEEDMTLAERKALMQQQQRRLSAAQKLQQPLSRSPQPPPAVERRTSKTRTYIPPTVTSPTATTASPSNPGLIYDSHQPRRSNAVDPMKQANMLSQWRQSLASPTPNFSAAQQDQVAGHTTAAARASMLHQKQWEAWNAKQAEEDEKAKQREREVAMRSGMMQGAHKEQLRKMQAEALKRVNESPK